MVRKKYLRAKWKQSGKSNLKRDREREAKRVGWRKDHKGEWYFERRKNRSDKKGIYGSISFHCY